MRRMGNESGQTLIFVALGMACILGFVGLAAVVSSMLHDRRIVQTAADTAALAAGNEYLYVSTVQSDVKTAGQKATAVDGITNGTNGTVTVNSPPLYGPHAGTAGYVEAIVQKTDYRYFLGLVGGSSASIAGRAVAWTGAPGTGCFYILESSGEAAHLQGSYTVGVPGCGIIDDSDSSDALDITGNGGSLTAGYIGVVGGVSGTLPAGQRATTGIVPVSDPLAGTLPEYTCTSTCTETLPNGTTSKGPACVAAPTAKGSTWGPATSSGAVCYTNATIPGNITMNPGTYIFTASTVSLGGNTGITADTGITFYFTTGSLSMVGTPNIEITAPSPTTNPGDPFDGVAYVQAPGNTSIMYINGDSSGLFDGVVYLPGAEMEISGNTTITLPKVIVSSFYDKGNATINITDEEPVGATPIKQVILVE